jgi:hypothetical protein
MKTTRILLSSLALSLGALACGDDTDSTDVGVDTGVRDSGVRDTGVRDTGVRDTGMPDTGVRDLGMPDSGDDEDAGVANPPSPTLGTQIDRMGRPAVATALIAFLGDEPAKGTRKDLYNSSAPATWQSEFKNEARSSLAIYDALDAVCGNQLLATQTSSTPERYETLATVLMDDRLYVNSATSTCTQYLSVEATAVGIPGLENNCGGRAPGSLNGYDVIDITYSVVSIGGVGGVTDGIGEDNVTHSDTDFPFLATP